MKISTVLVKREVFLKAVVITYFLLKTYFNLTIYYTITIIKIYISMDESSSSQKQIDSLIDRLWSSGARTGENSVLTKSEIKMITIKAKTIFALQPVFIELLPPLVVCGDIHGQFQDLLRIFMKCGDPSLTNYLFLGDYVDRGKQSINTICLLLLYKIKYPRNFFLLRGNHETWMVNKQYGFYEECKNTYSVKIWKLFNDMFDWFPIAAMINRRILCIHGGISPSLNNINQLKNIKRPLQVPESGLICDLLWSDPDCDCESFDENDRGTSCVYGFDSVQNILNKFELDLLVRAHQAINAGYDFPFRPNQNVVTVFSAPNYCGEYGNSGAVMTINEHMVCKFIIFEPKTNFVEIVNPKSSTSQSSSTPSLHDLIGD